MKTNDNLSKAINQEVSNLVLNDDVATCSYDTPLSEVIGLLSQRNIGSIVIVDEKKPIGIFTERDFLRKIAEHDLDLDTEVVGKYMTARPTCVSSNAKILNVMALMRIGRFRHVIVTDSNGNLENVISMKDVMDYLIDNFNESLRAI